MNKQIKVCHVTSAHPRYDTRILLKECISLKERGYGVYLIVNDQIENEIYKGVKIYSTGRIYVNRLKRMCFGVRDVYNIAKRMNADVYHLHDPELLTIAPILKRKGKKVIFDSHEAYYLQIRQKKYIPVLFRNIISKTYRLFEKAILKQIDAVICPGTIMGKNIFKSFAKKTVFIDNLPKLEDIEINQDCLPKNDKLNLREICYVGSLSKERGITNLVLAAYKANVVLYLAGNFSSKEYEAELKNMNEYKCVKYLGYLDKKEIYQLYNKVSIGMCTLLGVGQYNKGDNLPTKVYEYMLGGLPVILSDFPYNRKMVEKYDFGIVVNPNCVNEIANKINLLLEDSKKRMRMEENGKKLVLEKLNWKEEEKKLLNLYEVLLIKKG